jgi:hypothetical protein
MTVIVDGAANRTCRRPRFPEERYVSTAYEQDFSLASLFGRAVIREAAYNSRRQDLTFDAYIRDERQST